MGSQDNNNLLNVFDPSRCKERHESLQKDINYLTSLLQKDIDSILEKLTHQEHTVEEIRKVALKEIEDRIVRYVEECKNGILIQLDHKDEYLDSLADGLRDSISNAIKEVTQGINVQRREIDKVRQQVEEMLKDFPSDLINRLVQLEDWKKTNNLKRMREDLDELRDWKKSLPEDFAKKVNENSDFVKRVSWLGTILALLLTAAFAPLLNLLWTAIKHVLSTGGPTP